MTKLNYKQIMKDATERYHQIIDECINAQDYDKLVSLTCESLYGGEDTMPVDAIIIRYQYTANGDCYFMVDGIEVLVADLRDMRGKHSFFDVCLPVISYKDDDVHIYHVIPNTWLYGSTSEEFDKGKPVHTEFINAAREYIKAHNITPDLQRED